MTRSLAGSVALLSSSALAAATLCAQSLDRKVSAVSDGLVQFHFAARDGICGNGRNWLRTDEDGWYGSFNSETMRGEGCATGPVRVVITRANREVVKIDTYAGPLAVDPAAGQDLGAVPARDAVSYLLGLASNLDGRPAREALFPAMLADSAPVTPALLQLAKDQSRPRDLRRSAVSWASRRRAEPGGVGAATVARALDQIVRDRSESESVRQQALSTIAGFNRGEGIPVVMGLANENDQWLSRQAYQAIARSGDPRARQFIREAVQRTGLQDETRATLIRGLGDEYATGADLKLLRDLYPKLDSDREREALMSVVANAGGRDNTEWLLRIAQSQTESVQRRRRAISLLARLDDPRVRDALKGMVER